MKFKCIEYIIVISHVVYMQGIWHLPWYTLPPAWAVPMCEEQQSTCIMRWCSMYNHWFINIKRSVCYYWIIAKHQSNSQWQTGWRFMYILGYSYGVTRRGMTQCISASLLVLDRWSRPNMTVLCLILSKDCVNFIYLLYWQWWLIGNVESVSVPSPLSNAAQQRLTMTFGHCAIMCKDLWG